jgi:thiamine biosynthesis lipoprotein
MTSPGRASTTLAPRVDDVAVVTFEAMASPITLTVVGPGPDAASHLARAQQVVRDVGRICTRFDPASALSRANAAPDRWHDVPTTLAWAVAEAARAYRETDGLFDPRILDVLLSWGYDRSLPFASSDVDRGPAAVPALGPSHRIESVTSWQPEVVQTDGQWRLRLGGTPIDLGGIGKGLAARWAAAELAGAGRGFAVDLGGDCAFGGQSPDGGAWRVGVEDPTGQADLVLALEVTDTGCATSSVRLRRWRANGVPVHHLIDPRTRRPGGDGLLAVTVVAPDPAWSEVWSKTLFLAGPTGVRSRAEELGLAAAWVAADGTVGTSTRMDPTVIWRRADV